MKKTNIAIMTIFIIIILFSIIILVENKSRRDEENHKVNFTKSHCLQYVGALLMYQNKYNVMPNDLSKFIEAYNKEYPMSLSRNIDAWNTPYNYDPAIGIWSNGPNRINDNRKGDDIVFTFDELKKPLSPAVPPKK